MKILAVCGSGMGTSMLMKMKVTNVLKKLNITADLNSCSVGEAKSGLDNYDIILASTHIAKDLKANKAQIIGLKNILDELELEEKFKAAIKI